MRKITGNTFATASEAAVIVGPGKGPDVDRAKAARKSTEQHLAESLTDDRLANRLVMIVNESRSFTKAYRDALLREAAARLRLQ